MKASLEEVIQQIDDQWKNLLRVRSVFPTIDKDMVGSQHFETGGFYRQRGYDAEIRLSKPLTEEMIADLNLNGALINENYVVRLVAILELYKIIPQNRKGKMDQSLPGFKDVNILRLLRNEIVHHAGIYKPGDKKSKRLYKRMVKDSNISLESETPGNRFIVHIDTFLKLTTRGCKQYVQGLFQNGGPKEDILAPSCSKCGGLNIISSNKSFDSIEGILIYRGGCGAVISWSPKPQNS